MGTEGSWLTGRRATNRLVELTEELNRRAIEQLRMCYGEKFATYRPWMSCSRRLEYFLRGRPACLDHSSRPPLIIDPACLQCLRTAFAESAQRPLGYLGIEATDLGVAQNDSQGFIEWVQSVTKAYTLAANTDDSLQKRLQMLALEIVPLGPTSQDDLQGASGRGLSVHHYRGGIFLGPPPEGPYSTVELAISLVHELGHQAAMIYQYADRMLTVDYATPVYSAIRKTNRPAILSFHAVVALAYMCEFVALAIARSAPPEQDYLLQRLAAIRTDLQTGWTALRPLSFTELGEGMMQEVRTLFEQPI